MKNKNRILIFVLLLVVITEIILCKNTKNIKKDEFEVASKISKFSENTENTENTENKIGLDDDYEITYFYGICAEEMTEEQAELIANSGFTVIPLRPSPNIFWNPDEVNQAMDAAINNLNKYNLKVLVYDFRIDNALSLYSINNEEIAQSCLEDAVDFYDKYPNVVGFDVCDEPYYETNNPSVKNLDAVKKVVNKLYEIDSTKRSYVNLLREPCNALEEEQFRTSFNITNYKDYLYDAIDSKLKYLSIDHYPQYLNRIYGITIDKYYDNLKKLSDIYAEKKKEGYKNLITNNINLVMQFGDNKVAKQDIEYQVSTGLAFGTKMTSYFTYAAVTNDTYLGNVNGLLDTEKNPTNYYYYVKDINKWAMNEGKELYHKDLRATYLYNNTDLDEDTPTTEYIEYEDKTKIIGKICTNEFEGNLSIGSPTEDSSFALVSIFDDNTIMIVNTDSFRESDYSKAEAYADIPSEEKTRGQYKFVDITLKDEYQYFDCINNIWADITEDIDRLSDMGVAISKDGNFILIDKGRNILIRKKYTLTSNKYHINYESKKITVYDNDIEIILKNISSDYTVVVQKGTKSYSNGNINTTGYMLKVINEDLVLDTYFIEGVFSTNYDMNSRYIYTGFIGFNPSNVSTDVAISEKDNILNIESSDGVYYNNIPIISVSLANEYKISDNYIIISTDLFLESNVKVTNGYAQYDSFNNKLDIYSCFGDFIESKEIKKIYINPFEDVKEDQWYYNAVKYVYQNNIIKGYNSTTFAPNDNLTRGQLVTILHRMEGSPKETEESKFLDVQDANQYYYKAVVWAANKKIVSGYENGQFGPEDYITREQSAVILWKYARYKEKNISVSNDLKSFGDVNNISSWAVRQVKWAVGVGVITGNNNTNPLTINPTGNATRAEAAAMLEKYCKKVVR